MNGRYQKVWLNNVDFTSVHPALLLQHINEGDLELTQKWFDRPGGGQVMTANAPRKRDITIEFAIRDGRDYARRMEAFQVVCSWAYGGGWLEVSDRPGQRIYVTPSQMPTIGRLREWTEDMSIIFTAGWNPFWEETVPITASLSAVTSGSTTLAIPGNAQSCLEANITPSASLSSIVLGVAGTSTQITITPATAIASGTQVKIYYNDQHLLCIKAGTTDILSYRTGSDDLLVNPGLATINYTLSAACNVELIARGAWL